MPQDLYDAAQRRLAEGNNGGPSASDSNELRQHRSEPSLLAGKLFDAAGERLTPTHSRKGERRYRYYVSASLLQRQQQRHRQDHGYDQDGKASQLDQRDERQDARERGGQSGWRVPAQGVEQNVLRATLALLRDDTAVMSAAMDAGMPAQDVPRLRSQLASLLRHDGAGAMQQSMADTLITIVQRVELSDQAMLLTIGLPDLSARWTDRTTDQQTGDSRLEETIVIEHSVPHQVRRRGMEMRIVLGGGIEVRRDDPALLKVVARGRCWFDALAEGQVGSAKDLAAELGVDVRYVQRLIRLAMLAPNLVEAMAAGRHDAGLTVDRLTDHGPPPMRWSEQLGV